MSLDAGRKLVEAKLQLKKPIIRARTEERRYKLAVLPDSVKKRTVHANIEDKFYENKLCDSAEEQ